MKFTAKHVTLQVELTLLDGTEKTLQTAPLNAEASSSLLDRLIKEDEAFDKTHTDKSQPIYGELAQSYAKQLDAIYSTEEGFWLKNVDNSTIADVKRYVIDELLGVRKKS